MQLLLLTYSCTVLIRVTGGYDDVGGLPDSGGTKRERREREDREDREKTEETEPACSVVRMQKRACVCVVCATCKRETLCVLTSTPPPLFLPSSSGARRGEADGGTNTGVGRSATTGQGGAVQHPRLSLLELRTDT